MRKHSNVSWRHGLPELRTARLLLRLVRPDEASKLHRYAVRNREHLKPWETTRPAGYYEAAFWRNVPEEEKAAALRSEGLRLRIFLPANENEIIGVVSVRDIVHGEAHKAEIGYSLDATHQRRGYMTEALEAVLAYSFREFHLHRIEACIMPGNIASRRVLEKCGFQNEGVLRESLRIDGRWQDHMIWSLLEREFSARSLEDGSQKTTNLNQ